MSAAKAYREAVLALTGEYQVPVDTASELRASWRARVLTAGNRLDAAVLALMVEAMDKAAEDALFLNWQDCAQALLKGEELEKP